MEQAGSFPRPDPRWTRRRFLNLSLLASAAALGLPRLLRAAADCELTTRDILGPYWIDDAPQRTLLASPDEPGTRLFIRGRVFASNCATALEGTIVDVWHASDAGCYSVVEDCPDEDPMNLRGQMLAGPAGEYAYETVLPGYYPGRCRHIHLRVAPPSGQALVTQLYFAGDPRIEDDPFASQPGAAGRIIPLEEDGEGRLHGVFDMNLAVDSASIDDPSELLPARTRLHPCYPNPCRGATTVRYQLASAAPVDLAVFDAAGRRVRSLRRGAESAGYASAVWDGADERGRPVPSGMYRLRLELPGRVESCAVLVAR